MTRVPTYRDDFVRRHREALNLARSGHRVLMQPPSVRVVMPHEQEQSA